MKKISIFLMLLLTLTTLSGCNKNYKVYSENEEKQFIDKIYQYIDKNSSDYVLIDVRDKDEEYAKGHFYGFINYDINKGTTSEFVYKIKSMYTTDKTIFIIDKNGDDVRSLQDALKKEKYKKVIIYTGGFENLKKANNDDFKIVTGTSDCNC